jgi:hypothetical protein
MCDSLAQAQPRWSVADEAGAAGKGKVDAITRVQTEEVHLSVDQVIAVVDLFETNIPSAITYMALICEDMQQGLVDLGFPTEDNTWAKV